MLLCVSCKPLRECSELTGDTALQVVREAVFHSMERLSVLAPRNRTLKKDRNVVLLITYLMDRNQKAKSLVLGANFITLVFSLT